jgi:hypothetical protein
MSAIQNEINSFQALPQAQKDKGALALYKKVQKSSLPKAAKDEFIASLYRTEGLRSIQEYNSKIANSWGLEFVTANPYIVQSRFLGVYAFSTILAKLAVQTVVSIPAGIACLFKHKAPATKK